MTVRDEFSSYARPRPRQLLSRGLGTSRASARPHDLAAEHVARGPVRTQHYIVVDVGHVLSELTAPSASGGWGEIRTHGTLARSAVFKTAAPLRCGPGRGGIRTHETLARSAVFKTAAINHSATHPHGFLSVSGVLAQPERRDRWSPGRWRPPLGTASNPLTLSMRKHANSAGDANETRVRRNIDHRIDHSKSLAAPSACSHSVHVCPAGVVSRHGGRPNSRDSFLRPHVVAPSSADRTFGRLVRGLQTG